MDDQQRRANGLEMRRAVLGDAHVDRAIAQTTPLTQEFQDLITRYAWGEIWTRPGLDIRSRRILVIGTLIALGRWEEFEMHAAAALREGGFTVGDLKRDRLAAGDLLRRSRRASCDEAGRSARRLADVYFTIEIDMPSIVFPHDRDDDRFEPRVRGDGGIEGPRGARVLVARAIRPAPRRRGSGCRRRSPCPARDSCSARSR